MESLITCSFPSAQSVTSAPMIHPVPTLMFSFTVDKAMHNQGKPHFTDDWLRLRVVYWKMRGHVCLNLALFFLAV